MKEFSKLQQLLVISVSFVYLLLLGNWYCDFASNQNQYLIMLPVQKRTRVRHLVCKPFPEDNCALVGYFTGYDIEVFDPNSIKALNDTYGLNSKPRQMVTFNYHRLNKSTEAEYKRQLEWKEKFRDVPNESAERKVLIEERVLRDEKFVEH